MSEQKTHAEIVAEMRRRHFDVWVSEFRSYADRIEEAHKRELDAHKQRCAELDAEVAAKDEVIKRLNDAIAEEQRRKMATTEKSSAVDTKFELCNYPEQVLKIGRDFQNKDGFRGAHYDTVKLLCDTIEYQQEQLKTKTEVGNCAKLREALVRCRNCAQMIPPFVQASKPERSSLNDVDAALAAPPRNCDKYATADEALKAQEQMFNDSNFANGECKLGCPECDNPRVGCKIAWLFAPATEKEGGEK